MKASGRKATWTEIGVLKIKDGKIVESWYEVDAEHDPTIERDQKISGLFGLINQEEFK